VNLDEASEPVVGDSSGLKPLVQSCSCNSQSSRRFRQGEPLKSTRVGSVSEFDVPFECVHIVRGGEGDTEMLCPKGTSCLRACLSLP